MTRIATKRGAAITAAGPPQAFGGQPGVTLWKPSKKTSKRIKKLKRKAAKKRRLEP